MPYESLKKTLVLLCLLTGCGGGENEKETKIIERPAPNPNPNPRPNPGGDDVSFADIKPILDNNCALSGCHAGAGFLESEKRFQASNSKQRVGNGSMPPKYSPKYESWGDEEKAIILAYFDSN